MFQPIGGMTASRRLLRTGSSPRLRLNSRDGDQRRGNGVHILHGPGQQALDAEFCICTLPLNLPERIPSGTFHPPSGRRYAGSISGERQGRLRIVALLGEEDGI